MRRKVNRNVNYSGRPAIFGQPYLPRIACLLLVACIGIPQAHAFEFAAAVDLGPVTETVVSTTAFYVSITAASALLFCISIALRHVIWAAYMCLIVMGLSYVALQEQNLTGIYWTGVILTPRSQAFFGFLLASCVFLVAAFAINPDHRFIRFRKHLLMAAVSVWGIWLISLNIPEEIAILMFNITGAISGISHLIPLATFTRLQGGPDRLMRILVGGGLLAMVVAAVMVSVEAIGFRNQQTVINRIVMAACLIAFAYLFLNQIILVRSDREKAIQRNLDQAIEQARISRELLEAEKRHSAAQEVARLQNLRLATASHDIRQPISSLRTTMAVLADKEPPEIREQLKTAFEYLDQLAASYMAEAKAKDDDIGVNETVADSVSKSPNPIHDDVDDPAARAGTEPVSVKLITGTLKRMFAAEALERGLRFDVTTINETVKVKPLALMRILSNLVSNGLKHTSEGGVSIAVKKVGNKVCFTVANSAQFDIAQADAFTVWNKSETSGGYGLGLNVVQQQAKSAGFDLDITSTPQSGTEFTLSVPLTENVK